MQSVIHDMQSTQLESVLPLSEVNAIHKQQHTKQPHHSTENDAPRHCSALSPCSKCTASGSRPGIIAAQMTLVSLLCDLAPNALLSVHLSNLTRARGLSVSLCPWTIPTCTASSLCLWCHFTHTGGHNVLASVSLLTLTFGCDCSQQWLQLMTWANLLTNCS